MDGDETPMEEGTATEWRWTAMDMIVVRKNLSNSSLASLRVGEALNDHNSFKTINVSGKNKSRNHN